MIMRGRLHRLLAGMALLVSSLTHAEVLPLVDSAWLAEQRGKPGVVLVDIQSMEDFRRYHLPGSVNAPYAQWRTRDGMLPKTGYLERYLGRLGIKPDDHVVIIATGLSAGDMAASARVYWTLHVLGHEAMSVLNGGLAAYAQRYGIASLSSGNTSATATTYKAKPGLREVLGADQVKARLDAAASPVDARSVAEYLGLRRGGPSERPGTLPGARSLPFDWLTVEGGGELLQTDAIKRLMAARDVPLDGEQIHFCHTGNRASLTWFVSYALLGNTQARLYDGSTAEWASRADLPIDRKLEVDPSRP